MAATAFYAALQNQGWPELGTMLDFFTQLCAQCIQCYFCSKTTKDHCGPRKVPLYSPPTPPLITDIF